MSANIFDQRKEVWHGNYRGEVMDVNDPEQLGRARIRVFPFFKDIRAADLPWAVPAMPLWTGAGNGSGSFAVPVVGSMVFVFFEAGDPYQPVYFAEAQDGKNGLPSFRTTDYPNTRGNQSVSGVATYVDDDTGDVILDHPTGTRVRVTPSGEIRLAGVDRVSVVSAKDTSVSAGGDASLSGENVLVTAAMTAALQGGGVLVNASGTAVMQGVVGVQIMSTGAVQLTAGVTLTLTAVGVATLTGAGVFISAAGTVSLTAAFLELIAGTFLQLVVPPSGLTINGSPGITGAVHTNATPVLTFENGILIGFE